MIKNNEIGVYVHIPFCKKKCDYCDFISYCNKDNLIDGYVQAVKAEIQTQNIKPEITTTKNRKKAITCFIAIIRKRFTSCF